MSDTRMGANAATSEAVRIAEKFGGGTLGVSRDQAAEYLKSHGIEPPNADGSPRYTAPAAPKADDYTFDLIGVHADLEDPAAVLEGGKNLSAALALPEYLARAVTRGIAEAGDIAPETTEAWLTRAGHDPAALVAKVDALVAKAGPEYAKVITARELPAQVLLQLANWADHVERRGGQK